MDEKLHRLGQGRSEPGVQLRRLLLKLIYSDNWILVLADCVTMAPAVKFIHSTQNDSNRRSLITNLIVNWHPPSKCLQ